MIIVFHRTFEKKYARLPKKICEEFKERRNIFMRNRFDPVLNNHALTGEWLGCRSIDVTGDYRAILK